MEKPLIPRVSFRLCTSSSPLDQQQEAVKIGLRICSEVFTTHSGTQQEWMTRLHQHGVIFLAEVEGTPVAVLMGNRSAKFLPAGHKGSFHIWLTGVREKYQRMGIMTMLFSQLYQHASSEPLLRDLQIYTIATIPERFPGMPPFLKKHGYTEFIRDEIFDEQLQKRTHKVRYWHAIERPKLALS